MLSNEFEIFEELILRNLFKAARANSPSIIFIDEIDSLARTREYNSSNDTINQILTEMDGFSKDNKVLVIGCTNVIHFLDKAILRPGRFDRIIRIPLPHKESRRKLFDYYLTKINTEKEINKEKLVEV
jgi:ATP-dependent 26S proteasome regulatory subunit